ncbi:hypothetical protein [Runella limosa]|uniref:hypothetical protein n=1 Tax=Runella limosa TaxID=370978 RepID=UPI00048BFF54|nr:hypothetical protein [Runella limosa]
MFEQFANKETHSYDYGDLEPETSEVYVSKIDGSYICHAANTSMLKFLLKIGVTEEIQNAQNEKDATSNIGFNPKEQKWYGWSHRAICGFGIGSTCKKGDCHFIPSNKEEAIEDALNFWEDDCHSDIKCGDSVDKKGMPGLKISWTYNEKTPNKKLVGTTGGAFCHFPEKYGKGEWEATTMEDAKQMAIDFANEIG